MHKNETESGRHTRGRLVLGRSALLLAGGGISVALLFWAKLRVVTNLPRTTYAEPADNIYDDRDETLETTVQERADAENHDESEG